MKLAIMLVIAVLCGWIASTIAHGWVWANRIIGTLRRYEDPEDGTYFCMELEDKSLSKITDSQYVVLQVKSGNVNTIQFPQK